MADQEFERIVQEGLAAIKKSRERLKADRDNPGDWEEITPEPLKEAVRHIRREFKTAVWQLEQQVECGCYISLHPELATLPRYKGGDNLIRADLRETWHLQFEGMNEAERFADWVKQYSDVLEKNISTPFNAFLKISLANESNLHLPAVEWAKTITRGLLYSLKWTVPYLIKRMCDEQEYKIEIKTDNFEAQCAWAYWRAPQFVHMHPSGNSPFDAATAWDRSDDAEFTERLLRGLTDRMVEPAWFKLDRLAGEAYVSLASAPHIEPSANSAVGTVGPDREIAQAHDRVRHFEAEIAAIDTKIAAFQQSLTQAIVNGTSTFRPRDISKAISKLHADRKELEFRRDDWQLNLNTALIRAGVGKQITPDPQPSPAKDERIQEVTSAKTGGAQTRQGQQSGRNVQAAQSESPTGEGASRGPLLGVVSKVSYTSGIKRAIALLLSITPDASDLQLCRRFDEDGMVELPASWTSGDNRSFELAYKDPQHRSKIEKMISKVRSDMRRRGQLS